MPKQSRGVLPEERRFELLCHKVSSALAAAGVTPSAVLASLCEARKRAGGASDSGNHQGKTLRAEPGGTSHL